MKICTTVFTETEELTGVLRKALADLGKEYFPLSEAICPGCGSKVLSNSISPINCPKCGSEIVFRRFAPLTHRMRQRSAQPDLRG